MSPQTEKHPKKADVMKPKRKKNPLKILFSSLPTCARIFFPSARIKKMQYIIISVIPTVACKTICSHCSAFTKQNIQDSTDTSDFITVVFFHTTVMSCEFLYVSPGFPGLIFIVFEGLKNRRWETDSRDHCDRSSWRYRIVHFVPEVCVFIFCMQVSCINRQPGCADAWRCCCLYRDSTDYLHLIKMSRVCFVV